MGSGRGAAASTPAAAGARDRGRPAAAAPASPADAGAGSEGELRESAVDAVSTADPVSPTSPSASASAAGGGGTPMSGSADPAAAAAGGLRAPEAAAATRAPSETRAPEATADGGGDASPPPRGRLDAWRILDDAAERFGDRLAVVDCGAGSSNGDGALLLTYAQLRARAARLAAALEATPAGDAGFDGALRAAAEALLAHVADEEGDLLPRLAGALLPINLLTLGLQFEAAGARAPTRPHPGLPQVPPLNEAALAAAKQGAPLGG